MKAVLQIQTRRGSVLFLVQHVFTCLPEISMNDSHTPLPKSHQSGFCANSLNIGPAELVLGHHKLLQGGAGDFEKVTNNSNISALSQENTIQLKFKIARTPMPTSRLTSSPRVILAVCIEKMRCFVFSSGSGNSIFRSIRPGRS
jgi:hypothetical protein